MENAEKMARSVGILRKEIKMGIWQTILIGAAVSVIVIVFITAKDDEGDDRDDL